MGQSALEGIRTMATKISIDKIAVPADVIQAADKNPDSINNQNGTTDDE